MSYGIDIAKSTLYNNGLFDGSAIDYRVSGVIDDRIVNKSSSGLIEVVAQDKRLLPISYPIISGESNKEMGHSVIILSGEVSYTYREQTGIYSQDSNIITIFTG